MTRSSLESGPIKFARLFELFLDAAYFCCGRSISASGTSSTRSVSASATHGKTQPSFFSSFVNPGHSMRYDTVPLIKRHIQVRQEPFRHERGSLTWAAVAASRSETDGDDSNEYP